jgi:hypothetical protein
MSTRWVSPYHYRKLLEVADQFQHIRADPRRVRSHLVADGNCRERFAATVK